MKRLALFVVVKGGTLPVVYSISQNSNIPKPLHSRICIDPEKSKENHKVSYWRNLIKGINVSLLLKLFTISCCQWGPVCKSNLYSDKKIFILTRKQTPHTVTYGTAHIRCVFSCSNTLVWEKLTTHKQIDLQPFCHLSKCSCRTSWELELIKFLPGDVYFKTDPVSSTSQIVPFILMLFIRLLCFRARTAYSSSATCGPKDAEILSSLSAASTGRSALSWINWIHSN